jgi:hypothetical protein
MMMVDQVQQVLKQVAGIEIPEHGSGLELFFSLLNNK